MGEHSATHWRGQRASEKPGEGSEMRFMPPSTALAGLKMTLDPSLRILGCPSVLQFLRQCLLQSLHPAAPSVTRRFLMGRCSSISLSGSLIKCDIVNLSPQSNFSARAKHTSQNKTWALNGERALNVFKTFWECPCRHATKRCAASFAGIQI